MYCHAFSTTKFDRKRDSENNFATLLAHRSFEYNSPPRLDNTNGQTCFREANILKPTDMLTTTQLGARIRT